MGIYLLFKQEQPFPLIWDSWRFVLLRNRSGSRATSSWIASLLRRAGGSRPTVTNRRDVAPARPRTLDVDVLSLSTFERELVKDAIARL